MTKNEITFLLNEWMEMYGVPQEGISEIVAVYETFCGAFGNEETTEILEILKEIEKDS